MHVSPKLKKSENEVQRHDKKHISQANTQNLLFKIMNTYIVVKLHSMYSTCKYSLSLKPAQII